jgi:hypothetical protein
VPRVRFSPSIQRSRMPSKTMPHSSPGVAVALLARAAAGIDLDQQHLQVSGTRRRGQPLHHARPVEHDGLAGGGTDDVRIAVRRHRAGLLQQPAWTDAERGRQQAEGADRGHGQAALDLAEIADGDLGGLGEIDEREALRGPRRRILIGASIPSLCASSVALCFCGSRPHARLRRIFRRRRYSRSFSKGYFESTSMPVSVIRTCSSSFTPSRPPSLPVKLSTQSVVPASSTPS